MALGIASFVLIFCLTNIVSSAYDMKSSLCACTAMTDQYFTSVRYILRNSPHSAAIYSAGKKLDISSPWVSKGPSATLWSGRHTLSQPRGWFIHRGSGFLSPCICLGRLAPVVHDFKLRLQESIEVLAWSLRQMWSVLTLVVFNPFYWPIKSLLYGIKWVFKQQHLQMFDIKLNI